MDGELTIHQGGISKSKEGSIDTVLQIQVLTLDKRFMVACMSDKAKTLRLCEMNPIQLDPNLR